MNNALAGYGWYLFTAAVIGALLYQFSPLKSYWAALMYAFISQPGYVLKARSVRSARTVARAGEQEQPSRRQFYFNCYLPFLPALHFPRTPGANQQKKCKRTDRKTIAFQIELPAECVHFLNLTSLSLPLAHGKGRRRAGEQASRQPH